jgi:hypothetical protein
MPIPKLRYQYGAICEKISQAINRLDETHPRIRESME